MGDKKGDNKDILSKVMRIPIQTVSIEKAHRRKINLKLELMVEAEQITNNKEQYQRWYDSNKNSSTSSPIFKKVTFASVRLIFCCKGCQGNRIQFYPVTPIVEVLWIVSCFKAKLFPTTTKSIVKKRKDVSQPSGDSL